VATNSHVPLIGDAAHAMLIFAGKGGNHAFLDVVQLRGLLAQLSASEAAGELLEDEVPRWDDPITASEKSNHFAPSTYR
jgi:2-polyprenyl-6-methoxyphenol hydroxylase-like FAD-dependent oxidoreductase